jgi:hypothetical protein
MLSPALEQLKARPATPSSATMRLKIGRRELRKCTFNRKETLFTPWNSAGWIPLPAGPSPPAQEPLPPAPRVLEMMHDRSSGEAGDYDQQGGEHDALLLPSAGQSSVRRSHAERDRSRFGSIELFGPLGNVEAGLHQSQDRGRHAPAAPPPWRFGNLGAGPPCGACALGLCRGRPTWAHLGRKRATHRSCPLCARREGAGRVAKLQADGEQI